MTYCLASFTSLIPRFNDEQIASTWYATSEILEPSLHEVQTVEPGLAKVWADFLLVLGTSQYRRDAEDQEDEDPFKMAVKTTNTRSRTPTEIYRNAITRYMNKGDLWRDSLVASAKRMVRVFSMLYPL